MGCRMFGEEVGVRIPVGTEIYLFTTSTPAVEPPFGLILLLLLWRYNSDRVLAFSTISFHFGRSWTCSSYFVSFTFFRSFLTSSSHGDSGLPAGLPVNVFHLCILFTMLVSGILFICPNQLSLWALTSWTRNYFFFSFSTPCI